MRNSYGNKRQYGEQYRFNKELYVVNSTFGKSGGHECGDNTEKHGRVESHNGVEHEESCVNAVTATEKECGHKNHGEKTEHEIGNVGKQAHYESLVLARSHSAEQIREFLDASEKDFIDFKYERTAAPGKFADPVMQRSFP